MSFKEKLTNPTRRQMLVAGGLAGGGLLIGYAFSGPSRHTLAERAVAGKDEHVFATWLKISPDNTVTVYVPHADMGQGVVTALAMMAAEEMEADWSLVRAETAPAEKAFANENFGQRYTEGLNIPPMFQGLSDAAMLKVAQFMNVQITGGSSSIRWTGQHGMRPAGASAKDMLIRAAAARWNVAPGECVAKLSHVTHPSGKSASFAELCADAAELSPPSHPVLKAKADYTIVGQPIPRFDIPDKVNGTAMYGVDVRRPGQLYAAIKFTPVFGSEIVSYDAKQVLSRNGVKKVVALPGVGVAVVADNFWRAKEAAKALDVKFDAKGNDALSTKTIYAQHDADIAKGDGSKDVETGDAETALKGAAKRIEATYRVPYLAHACMEPMNCTVWISGGKAEVWVGSQSPLSVRGRVAEISGLDFENVTVHPLLLGGGFGRRVTVVKGFIDFPSEIDFATLIAKEVDAPVQLLYTREDDIQHDAYRIAVTSRFEAALDTDGNPTVWTNLYTSKDEPGEAAHIPYAVPNRSIRYVESPTPVPRGPWRSVAHSQHTFFTESFMDELAHAAGKDPFEYRRALLKDEPRHLAVLELAAAKAGWGTPLEKGHARGIAIQQSFNSIVAEVAEVSVSPSGELKVHRVTAAVDCGNTINPDTARQQVESGVIYGLTAALHGEITIEKGAVAQSNFPDYEMLRLADVPEIEVHFIDSGAALGGLGEPATPPIAAAVANAVFAATGKRIRELPMKKHDLTPLSAKLAQAAD
ncbi:MAG: molybdopterin-dependent oxidoreductase [Parvibaculum sp.]|uniref:xanthine dehydrogenase family protein molybdopterin-binding subunit n=1 Tax=Parvibaculum sp. TaxID=2024848 RepID=UPI0025E59ED5|nr:molybdopterin cofactor-binding domain-containing protein [Parvibaculum sp.]MCE9650041.1 molybdopterin-dependent oxidoreductase [Parvibaculum sp.]